MSDRVFVARNGLVANGTFLANSTVVNAAAITATSVNAATLSISGTSVATLITSNAATAYSNGTAYADARAANAFSNAVALSGNATNLTTGILPLARLDANVINTSAAFTITGTRTFNANVTFGASARFIANGSPGTAGQLLSSNGSGVYWADLGSVGTNTATPYSWTNTHVFSNTVTVNNSTFSVGSASVNTTITLGTITLSNGAAVATVNSTVYNGTANNASFFNGESASFYTNASNLLTGTVAAARLGFGSPNSSTFLRGDQTWASIPSSGGTVTQVSTGSGLTGGPITTSGTISHATGGPGTGTHSGGISSITIDQFGHISSISGGAGYVGTGSVVRLGGLSVSSSITPAAGVIYADNDIIAGGNFISYGSQVQIFRPSAAEVRYTYQNNNRGVYTYLNAAEWGLWDVNVGIKRFWTDASGNLTAAGNISGSSDERLKENINTIDNALSMVEAMRGVSYTRKFDQSNQIGLVAQEVKEVLPQVVMEDAQGYMSVAYGNIVGVLVEAIKELSAEVKTMKAEIAQLKAQQ